MTMMNGNDWYNGEAHDNGLGFKIDFSFLLYNGPACEMCLYSANKVEY